MHRVAAFALRQQALMVAVLVFVCVAGLVSFMRLNIEAYPDPVPPLVDVVTQNPGQSAEEIERYVTIPLEIQMAGIAHVATIRTISLFGLSDVKLQFTYEVSYGEAEQAVINQLALLSSLPAGVKPQISPWSPVGEIFRYRVVGPPSYSTTDLRTIEDWQLERRFKAVPGVIDVNGWGGKSKTYDVVVDLKRLDDAGLTLQQVVQAINANNVNVGGQTLNIGPHAAVVRGIGLIQSLEAIRDTILPVSGGAPIRVRDIAEVEAGYQPRLGIAGQDDDDDIVQGIVLMRRGEQTTPTIRRVEAEMDKINASGILPEGVRLERIYDRSELIGLTTEKVLTNLSFGIILIFVVQLLFLGSLRTAIVVAATIPFALFFAIILLTLTGESANLLSVGAIDFGLIVDATVILVENVFRRLSEAAAARPTGDPFRDMAAPEGLAGKIAAIANAIGEVDRAVLFSALIIIAAFVPLFTLSGIEGHIFGPMAKTYAYAIVGALIATFTVSPALGALLLPERIPQTETLIVRTLRRYYGPALEFALANRVVTLGCVTWLAAVAAFAAWTLGLEFLPHLEERNLWIRATMPQSISLEEANTYVNRMRKVIGTFPEVETVVSQHGRPQDGTDATGFFNAEFFVPLKPLSEWPPRIYKDDLTDRINDELRVSFPGVSFNFSQYIEDNVEEAASGVKGENSVKIFGGDLTVLESIATKIREAMWTVRGIADLAIYDALGQLTLNIDIDRERAARFGLAPGDINAAIQAGIGGQTAGSLYEPGSDRNFPIVVRLKPEYRGNVDAIRNLSIMAANPGGSGVIRIPLREVARVSLVSGPSMIYREQQERYVPIRFGVRKRDLGGAVREAQERVAASVPLPAGYRLEWVGQFRDLTAALERLGFIVPLSIGVILLLLLANFRSLIDALLAASAMPMALVGGIFALVVTNMPFSVSAAIGFVGLFGIAVMEGIIILSYFNRLAEAGFNRTGAIISACQARLRPVMMTCIAACVGLLPAALSYGVGAQVQRPLAIVVVGGNLLAPLLILIVLPVLIDIFSRRARTQAAAVQSAERAA
ncbi:MAG: efflux RND transporter permease subunit [Methylobacteriaceae bacterium]|nr:efflux RND transporter permease subunit [Methylobacteriaceae bacterium]